MSIARYAATMAVTQGPRETEIRAFRHVNGLLAGAGEDIAARAVALRKNFQLWSMLLADLMLPANALPEELKARLASLSLWAQGESNRALRDDDRSLEPLMAVNRDMIEALEAQGRGGGSALPAGAMQSGAAPSAAARSAPARQLAATA
jgi:flagellar protein FlaF